MKAEDKKKMVRIEEAFRNIYRSEPDAEVSGQWPKAVMAEIRREGEFAGSCPDNGKTQFLYWAQRLAVGGAIAASLLVIYSFTSSSLPEEELAGIMVTEPEAVGLGEYQDW